MDKLVENYDHDFPDFLQRTFSGLENPLTSVPGQGAWCRSTAGTGSEGKGSLEEGAVDKLLVGE
jgi:hypothetical protein